jgi:tRNA A37 threonylcarbamoyladenosine synthetase subunit TsaC/SUA5/YrdC
MSDHALLWQPNSVSAADVLMQLAGRVDLLLDRGSMPGDVPSTVVDCTGEKAKVLRWGAIGRAALGDALEEKLADYLKVSQRLAFFRNSLCG